MPFLSWHLALALLTVAMVSAGLKFQMMRRNGASSDVDIPQTRPSSSKNTAEQEIQAEPSIFSCLPKSKSNARRRTPILLLSTEYAGSSSLVDNIHDFVAQRSGSIDFLSLFDIFATKNHHESGEATALTFRAVQAMADNCIDKDLGPFPQLLKDSWNNETAIRARPLEALDFLLHQERKRPTLKKLVRLSGSPANVIDFLSRIPSHARAAFMGIRITPQDLGSSLSDTTSFVASVHDTFMSEESDVTPIVIIAWQRRLIASYVLKEQQRQKTKTIVIQKAELEAYIEEVTTYWKTLRNTLETLQIPYHTLEYERDVGSNNVSLNGKLLDIFDSSATTLESDGYSDSKTLQSKRRRRATRVSLRAKVSNWEEVVRWGYGSGPWENLFD